MKAAAAATSSDAPKGIEQRLLRGHRRRDYSTALAICCTLGRRRAMTANMEGETAMTRRRCQPAAADVCSHQTTRRGHDPHDTNNCRDAVTDGGYLRHQSPWAGSRGPELLPYPSRGGS